MLVARFSASNIHLSQRKQRQAGDQFNQDWSLPPRGDGEELGNEAGEPWSVGWAARRGEPVGVGPVTLTMKIILG